MPSGWEGIHGESFWTDAGQDLMPIYNRTGFRGVRAIPLGLTAPGSDTGKAWLPNDEQGHGLCFAPTRTGKGASVIIPMLLTYSAEPSLFVIDPKGENAWVTAPRRREIGNKVVILDPMGEVNRAHAEGKPVEKITTFNPLSELDETSQTFSDDVATIGEALIITPPEEHNKHFSESAREFTTGIVALVKEAFGAQATLNHVRRLIIGDPDDLTALFEHVASTKPESVGVRKLRRFITHGTDEIKNVRSTAETQTAFLDSQDMQAALVDDPDNKFTMEDWTRGGVTIYVVLPPARLVTHARWMRLMLALTLRAVSAVDVPPEVPNLLIVDEMGTIGALKPLEDAFGLLAGYGVRFFGFYQSLTQMKRDYPHSWQNLIGNCSYLQLLAGRDTETCKFFSEMLGSTTVQSVDRTKQVRKPLMDPEQIARLLGASPAQLDQNMQVVIGLQGNQKFKVYQNPYFKQARFSSWYRPLPRYTNVQPAYVDPRTQKAVPKTAPATSRPVSSPRPTPTNSAPQTAVSTQQRGGGLLNFNTKTSKVFAGIAALCGLVWAAQLVIYTLPLMLRHGVGVLRPEWVFSYWTFDFLMAFGLARMATTKD